MPLQTILNLTALALSTGGTCLMFLFTPKINSQTFLYRREEMPALRKRDAKKQRVVTTGMILLLLACLLQAIGLFLPSANTIK